MGLSSFASKPIEEVVAANPQTFFQIYWSGHARADARSALRPGRAAGAVGLIVTLDWSFSHGRDWGSPTIPEQLDLKTMAAATRPRCCARPRWLRAVGAHRAAARPDRAEHGAARRAGRRRSSAPTASGCRPPPPTLGRPRAGCASSGTARSCSRASCASTTPGARSTSASPRSRSPTTAATTSTAPRPRSGRCPPIAEAVGDRDRGPARRRHPPRQRRRQGARARRPRGDDRPRLPLGPGRQRPGRRGERARHPAQRHRLRPARPRPLVGAPT